MHRLLDIHESVSHAVDLTGDGWREALHVRVGYRHGRVQPREGEVRLSKIERRYRCENRAL